MEVSSFCALPEAVDDGNSAGMVLEWQPMAGLLFAGGSASVVRVWDVARSQCVGLAHTERGASVTSIASAWPGNGVAMLGHDDGAISLIDHRVPATMSTSGVGSPWDASLSSAVRNVLSARIAASMATDTPSGAASLSSLAGMAKRGGVGLTWRGLGGVARDAAMRAAWQSAGGGSGAGSGGVGGGGIATVLRLGQSEGLAELLQPHGAERWRRGSRRAHDSWVLRVAQPRGGAWFEGVSADLNGGLAWWDLRHTAPVKLVRAFRTKLTAMATHDWSRIVAVGTQGQRVSMYGPGGCDATAPGSTHSDAAEAGTSSSSSSLPSSSSAHMPPGTPRQIIKHLEGFLGQRIAPVSCLEFHPHDPVLAVGGTNNLVALFTSGWTPPGGMGEASSAEAAVAAAAAQAAHHRAASEAAGSAARVVAAMAEHRGTEEGSKAVRAAAIKAQAAAISTVEAMASVQRARATGVPEAGAQWAGVMALRGAEWDSLAAAGMQQLKAAPLDSAQQPASAAASGSSGKAERSVSAIGAATLLSV
jgi:hypothetical protein